MESRPEERMATCFMPIVLSSQYPSLSTLTCRRGDVTGVRKGYAGGVSGV